MTDKVGEAMYMEGEGWEIRNEDSNAIIVCQKPLECVTTSGTPCILPFTSHVDGKTYDGCRQRGTRDSSSNRLLSEGDCPTEVDLNGTSNATVMQECDLTTCPLQKQCELLHCIYIHVLYM